MVFPGRVYPSFRYFPVPVQQLPPLVSTTPFVGKKCEMNGVEGICQDYTTTACPNGSYVKGKCAGPNSVQCCVPNLTKENYATGVGSSCSVNGIKGVCRDTYTTSCTGGKFVTGKCPGPKNVQCCAPTASEFAGTPCGTGGSCQDVNTTNCSGTILSGLCPGPSNIKCCQPPISSTLPPSTDCALPRGTNMDAYENGKKIGQVEVIKYQGKNVSRPLACAFQKMEQAYGKTLKINSGFRTMEEQQYFYNCYLTKSCNNGNLAAKPGYSNHQNGTAVDITSSDYSWLSKYAHKYGFIRTVKSEKWHWEYKPGYSRPTWY